MSDIILLTGTKKSAGSISERFVCSLVLVKGNFSGCYAFSYEIPSWLSNWHEDYRPKNENKKSKRRTSRSETSLISAGKFLQGQLHKHHLEKHVLVALGLMQGSFCRKAGPTLTFPSTASVQDKLFVGFLLLETRRLLL